MVILIFKKNEIIVGSLIIKLIGNKRRLLTQNHMFRLERSKKVFIHINCISYNLPEIWIPEIWILNLQN